MIYFIQSTIYAALLYIVYLLFLKNRTSHQWSRAYLLMNIALPFVLPLIKIPGLQSDPSAVNSVMLPVINIGAEVSAKTDSINWLPVTYLAVSATLLGYLMAQAIHLALFIRRHPAEKHGSIYLVRNTKMGPGSWFNYVFIPGQDTEEAVLKHELAHVAYGHSYDIIFARLALCIAWPNVMLWLIINELKTVHEFQADKAAVNDKELYGTTLLNELFHTKHFALSHTFFHHPIKRRIMMLQKSKSRTGKMKVVTLSLLLITGILYLQCAKDNKPGNASSGAATENIEGPKEMKKIDKMPEFDGNLMDFLSRNVVYPKYAKDKKIEGRVVVKMSIDETGAIATIDVIESPDESLTKAALDAIHKMPKWKAGEDKGRKMKVYIMLPILFKLEVPEPTAFERMPSSRFLTHKMRSDAGTIIYAKGGC